MRRTVLLVLAGLSGCGQAPGRAVSASGAAAPVCLASYLIDHTDIPDDSTIVFTMRDHAVYRNHLVSACTGLRLDPRGFTYEASDPGSDTLCSNLVLIRLNTYHNVCMLGAFVKTSAQPPSR